jgi:hypothetical protein
MEQEQQKCGGFKYILNEIIKKRILNADDIKLTCQITLDFEEYAQTVKRA